MPLNDLFATNTTVRLSSDTNSWSDQIVSTLLNKFPALSKLVGEVTFSKVDTIKGNAVGYIALIGKPHQRIPFIVDQMELNPLDLYIDNMMYLPLTENTVKRIGSADWPFRLLSQTERTGLLKVASLFDEDTGELRNDFIKSHKAELAKVATEYPEIVENYSVQNIPEKVEEKKVIHFFVKEASDKPIVARTMKKEEPDKNYKISEIVKLYGPDFVTKLMTDKHIIWSNLPPTVKLKLEDKEVHSAYKTTTSNIGYVLEGGDPIPAKRFSHYKISTLEPKRPIDSNIIITKNGTVPQRELVNLTTPKTTDFSFSLPPVKGGDIAGIVYGDKFFGPFYIENIANIVGEKVVTILDNELKQIRLRFSDDIKSIIPLDEENYLVSNHVQLIPVQDYYNKPDSDSHITDIVKNASSNVTIAKQLNGKHTIMDGGVSGIGANNLKDLKKQDAVVVLMNCGLSENDAKYALMLANTKGSYSFQPGMNKKASIQEKDESLDKLANEIVKKCDDSELIKVALVSGDKSNIDMALGLNLITYNNIKRFKLVVPEIYEMLDRLCKLLIVKRMNRSLISIDDSQLTQAIFALDDIAASLGSL